LQETSVQSHSGRYSKLSSSCSSPVCDGLQGTGWTTVGRSVTRCLVSTVYRVGLDVSWTLPSSEPLSLSIVKCIGLLA